MKIHLLHSWDLSYFDARKVQKELAGRVEFVPFKPKKSILAAGIDCACEKDGKKIVAVIVLMLIPEFEVVETAEAACDLKFPYIPGLLSFREAPACIAAVEKLKAEPDIIIVDGQGIAHPRRLGIAAHLGLIFDRPTVGCAKSLLIGEYGRLGRNKGEYAMLIDKGETIGAVVRTRQDVKPVYVSVGNKCLLQNAVEIVLRCTTRYRLPEPIRLAHKLVTKLTN